MPAQSLLTWIFASLAIAAEPAPPAATSGDLQTLLRDAAKKCDLALQQQGHIPPANANTCKFESALVSGNQDSFVLKNLKQTAGDCKAALSQMKTLIEDRANISQYCDAQSSMAAQKVAAATSGAGAQAMLDLANLGRSTINTLEKCVKAMDYLQTETGRLDSYFKVFPFTLIARGRFRGFRKQAEWLDSEMKSVAANARSGMAGAESCPGVSPTWASQHTLFMDALQALRAAAAKASQETESYTAKYRDAEALVGNTVGIDTGRAKSMSTITK